MGVRNKLKKPQSAPRKSGLAKMPAWANESSTTTHALYQAAQQEYAHIVSLITNGKARRPKERQLVRAKIAKMAGFDRSLINPRRQFELCHWIEQKNRDLENLFNLHKPERQPTKNQSKRDLERTITALRKTQSEQNEVERRAIVEAFFDSHMLDDRNKLQRENSRLRLDNEQLYDKVARLQQQSLDDTRLIARLMAVLSPAQRIEIADLTLVPSTERPPDR